MRSTPMVDTSQDPGAAHELPAHRASFALFSKLVLFGALHVGLVLSCLALAFMGHSPTIALILGLGGTVGLIGAVAAF
ncbi:MAG: hypothetical protein U1E23_17170 [Reyranellaceae bacterium]